MTAIECNVIVISVIVIAYILLMILKESHVPGNYKTIIPCIYI